MYAIGTSHGVTHGGTAVGACSVGVRRGTAVGVRCRWVYGGEQLSVYGVYWSVYGGTAVGGRCLSLLVSSSGLRLVFVGRGQLTLQAVPACRVSLPTMPTNNPPPQTQTEAAGRFRLLPARQRCLRYRVPRLGYACLCLKYTKG